MKKMSVLLATVSVVFSTAIFAESTNPNDVLQTIPGASDKMVVAEAETVTTQEPVKKVISAKKTSHHQAVKKPAKKHSSQHHKKQASAKHKKQGKKHHKKA